MTSKNITITSKNQITLPAEFVRKLKLDKNRRLNVRQRGNELILKPEPSLDKILADIHARTAKYVKRPLSDAELKEAARNAYANKKI